MPFEYYNHLSAEDRRTYRQSDAITSVDLPADCDLSDEVEALRYALEDGRCRPVQRAAVDLCGEIFGWLEVSMTNVRIRAVRPQDRDGAELHGMYTREDGKVPIIEVWMRTARHRNVVKFKTFLRTLVHEALHHLDHELYEMDETFHTEGFFKRESSLFKRLMADWDASYELVDDEDAEPEDEASEQPPRQREQLRLF